MSNKSPIFPIPEPQHFSDYGFDPQIDYFQVMEEARLHKRESTSRPMDLHFRLTKPNTKDESKKIKKNKKHWWRNALHFFKNHKWGTPGGAAEFGGHARIGTISGPVYVTESRSGSGTPYRTASRPGSGQLDIPYFSLREMNMDQHHRISTAAIPIYLVT